MNIRTLIIKSVVTFFGVGKAPYAPGTFGSLCAFPLLIWVLKFAQKNNLFIYYSPLKLAIFLVILLTIIGSHLTDKYIKISNNNDPSEVVIDEVVGQLITIIGIFYFFTFIPTEMLKYLMGFFKNIYNLVYLKLISSFILFRFFDISKPWPVSYADKKIKGGIGVMFDDIFASLLSIITFFSILYVGYFLKVSF